MLYVADKILYVHYATSMSIFKSIHNVAEKHLNSYSISFVNIEDRDETLNQIYFQNSSELILKNIGLPYYTLSWSWKTL